MKNKPTNHGKKWNKQDLENIYKLLSKHQKDPNIYQALAEKYSRTEKAIFREGNKILREKFISERGISKLIHFTDIRNLASIKLHGLLSIKSLKKNNIPYYFCDEDRHDNMPNATSLSITNRNNFLFNIYKNRYSNTQWIELEIDPTIIINALCYFYDTNAANKKFNAERESLDDIAALKNMFADSVMTKGGRIKRVNQNRNETTCLQAEIMIVNRIPPNMIKAIRKIDVS